MLKKFSLIIILLLTALIAVSCGGEGETVETTVADTTAPAPETTALIPVESTTVTVNNPGWGFPAYSLEIADPNILSAERPK